MLFILLCIQVVVTVPALSEVTPAPPQNIHVEKWLLTWTPATEERDVTYTVQYQSFDTSVWRDIPACVHTSFTSCNVAFSKAESKHGCVTLRVQAERRGLTSTPVQACSRHGDSCTPEVSLTARPGSLTVFLSRNHSLAEEYGDHVTHRVYYGKEGESLEEKYKETLSSVSFLGLEEGQRYCTRVQYVRYNEAVGTRSCPQCEVIPRTKHEPVQTEVIVGVVVVVFLVLTPVIVYILICHRGRVKQWLRPATCDIPDFLLQPYPEHHMLSSPNSPSEERYDVISFITPEEVRGQLQLPPPSAPAPPALG
ncbi:interferon alpha/beta receptor 1-like [Trachinotus anak]|uniref:interferon alpha/beta receptor 1-like n=1 Tax=Trachinotus anak TaxID=443729 RepID=UPI0039F24E94